MQNSLGTYPIGGKEYPVIGLLRFKGQAVPVVGVPVMSDFR